jgi:hypothetical protein
MPTLLGLLLIFFILFFLLSGAIWPTVVGMGWIIAGLSAVAIFVQSFRIIFGILGKFLHGITDPEVFQSQKFNPF